MGLGSSSSSTSSSASNAASYSWSLANMLLGHRDARAKGSHLPLPFSTFHHRSWSADGTWVAVQRQQECIRRQGNALARQFAFFAYTLCQRAYYASLMGLRPVYQLAVAQMRTLSIVQLVITICLGILLFFIASLLLVRSRSQRRISLMHEKIRQQNYSEFDGGMDSDDFEEDFEEDDVGYDDESGVVKKLSGLPRGQRNTSFGANESIHAKRSRPNSIIRITSSDPRSQLSVHAIQMDLGSTGSINRGAAASANAGSSTSSSPGPHSRTRKESGRLLSGPTESHSSSSSSSSSPIHAHSSPHLVRAIHSAGRTAKQRRSGSRTLDHEKRQNRSDSLQRHSNRSSLRNSVIGSIASDISPPGSPNSMQSYASAQSDEDLYWHDTTPSASSLSLASILRREPQFYASLPHLATLQANSYDGDAKATEGDEFALWKQTMSFAEGDGFANGDVFSSLPPSSMLQNRSSRLPPGAAHATNSPLGKQKPALRLGTLSPEQMQALWPEKRSRQVRLREPDWKPYVDVHERARERLEKFAQVVGTTASPQRAQSPTSQGTSSASEEPGSESSSLVEKDEELFWFERFTQSTAASGRDWDWRKRRARLNGMRRASSLGPLETSALQAKPLPDQPADGNAEITSGHSVRQSLPDSTSAQNDTISNAAMHGSPLSSEQSGGAGFTPIKHTQKQPEIDESDAQGLLSVPGRLSSLKPKGVKKMLGRRDKSQSKTAQTKGSPNHSSTSDGDGKVDGWTVEPDLSALAMTTSEILAADEDAIQRALKNEVPKEQSSLSHLRHAFADSTPNLTLTMPTTPANSVSSSLSFPVHGWEEQQVWSSADAYGASPRANGARSNSAVTRQSEQAPTWRPQTLSAHATNLYNNGFVSHEVNAGYEPRRVDTDPYQEHRDQRGHSPIVKSEILSDTSAANLVVPSSTRPRAARSSSSKSSPSRRAIVENTRR